MEVLGLAFVGTRTDQRDDMTRFATEVLGLSPATDHGMDADVFGLPDGSTFAVAAVERTEDVERTVGFRVADLDVALAELRRSGVETDEAVSQNATQRYVHFRGPDGRLYELVEDRA